MWVILPSSSNSAMIIFNFSLKKNHRYTPTDVQYKKEKHVDASCLSDILLHPKIVHQL